MIDIKIEQREEVLTISIILHNHIHSLNVRPKVAFLIPRSEPKIKQVYLFLQPSIIARVELTPYQDTF